MHVWRSFRFVRRSGGKKVRRCDRCREPLWQHLVVMMMMMIVMQRAKKVVSDSPGPVDFAIRLVNSVFNLPDGQVTFFEEFE